MATKLFKLIIIVAFASCGQSDKLSGKFKTGLLDFSVNKSNVLRQLENGETSEFGALWTGLNKINVRTSHATLIVDVNVELSPSLDYDGGFELARDTLFLYAKRLDQTDTIETVHSTLSYKISAYGLKYKEIYFKRLI